MMMMMMTYIIVKKHSEIINKTRIIDSKIMRDTVNHTNAAKVRDVF